VHDQLNKANLLNFIWTYYSWYVISDLV